MSAEADIVIVDRSNVLLVPDRAITKDSEGNPVVMVVVNEQTEERPVVIGISDGFDTEIVSGLSEGEVVVVER
jgi:multidrug efflux pump subunit AcrA (membrane-fusion protein)